MKNSEIGELIKGFENLRIEIEKMNEHKRSIQEKLTRLVEDGATYGDFKTTLKIYPEGTKYFSWSKAEEGLTTVILEKIRPFLKVSERVSLTFKRMTTHE